MILIKHTLHQAFAICIFFLFTVFIACGSATPPAENVIVQQPQEAEVKFSGYMKDVLNYIKENNGILNDSIKLKNEKLVNKVYEEKSLSAIWSNEFTWLPMADSLQYFIIHSKEYGLFPADYHLTTLQAIRKKIDTDSLSRKNIALWARADMMYTDAWFQLAHDLKVGHLPKDSITLRNDSLLTDDFYYNAFQQSLNNKNMLQGLRQMEPVHAGYMQLKAAIPAFLDSVSFKKITYLKYPYKDSVKFYDQLQIRLAELGYVKKEAIPLDTSALKEAILKYQKTKALKQSGKVSESMVRLMNQSDWEKFKRIAINMDRYRALADTFPTTYIWVNLPAYTLYVYDDDTLALQSKVIVGNPKTRTPVLSSEVTNFVTYPQWTVPYSIIFKEMLPKIQKDINYLNRQNLMVVDKNDSVINPVTVDWNKLNAKHFPYYIKQRQGDDNSLGVMKFNFRNKYSVYLHDTNARGLFSRSSRALSHGCVRVQEWSKLSQFLVRNDTIKYSTDTLNAWISRQEKHVVSDFPRVPVFFRYITCEGKNGKVKFFEDIYAEDRLLAEKYFAEKAIQ